MTNQIDCTITSSGTSLTVTGSPTVASRVSSILTSLSQKNGAAFAKLLKGKGFSASLEPAGPLFKLIITTTLEDSKTHKLTLKFNPEQVKDFIPQTGPGPLTVSLGAAASFAVGYLVSPLITIALFTAGAAAVLYSRSSVPSAPDVNFEVSPVVSTPPPPAPLNPTPPPKPAPKSSVLISPLRAAPVSYDVPNICGIRNGGPQGGDGSTCFMNAAFQLIMNDEELLRALVETYREAIDESTEASVLLPSLTQLPDVEATQKKILKPEVLQAYIHFITAFEGYRAGKIGEIDINHLRAIFYNANRPFVQGDASEVIFALLSPVDGKKYPGLFFDQRIERRFVPYEPTWWERTVTLPDRIKEKQAGGRDLKDSYDIIPMDGIVIAPEPNTYSFPITLESGETDGTKLIHQMFQVTPRPDQKHINSVTGYFANQAAKDRGEVSWYYPLTIKTTIQAPPQRFMIDLKRFRDGRKISTPIHMPQEVTVQGQKYRLKTIVVHSGTVTGGHYYAFVRKKDSWYEANDSHVSPNPIDPQVGLDNGYLYWYEKV